MMTLSLKLKEYRERKGLSQAQLAEAVGVRQATISGLETGKSRRIELDLLEKLARVLGVKPATLLVADKPKRRVK
jgi:transcriptional regulator with XRE-family HTH domain